MLEQQYQHDISKQAARFDFYLCIHSFITKQYLINIFRQKEHYTRNAEQSLKKFNTPEPESKATNVFNLLAI